MVSPVWKTEINGRDILYLLKFALTLSTSGGRSVGVVPLRTKATEFFFFANTGFRYYAINNADT
jgi:hypothetical protein